MNRLLTPLVLAGLLGLGALAGTAVAGGSVDLPTIPELRQQLTDLKHDLPGDTRLNANKKVEIQDAIARIEQRIQGRDTYGSMDDAQRNDMVNDVSLIHFALVNKDDDRLICKRERAIGSNRITSTCATAAQWEEARKRSQEALEAQSRACNQGACGGGG
jgi:hypothetical protein